VPTPEFVLKLREAVGTAPLWLVGVSAVLQDDEGRVLLVRRSDNGEWSSVSGIVDPGEHPAVAALRELREEAGVIGEIERLAQVGVTKLITYPNGDQTQYTSLVFRCRYVAGDAAVGDDESLEVGWFGLDALPPLSPTELHRLEVALADRPDTVLDLEPEV
jgi:ADP-ribose pyrophosphatase YjhB (NUDIX family)